MTPSTQTSKKLHIGLLFGGKSGEHEVSIVSALSIYKALDPSKYDVTFVGIDKGGRWVLPSKQEILAYLPRPRDLKLDLLTRSVGLLPFPAPEPLVGLNQEGTVGQDAPVRPFDVVLPILHGTYGEDGTVQGLLELAQIPYVGSGVLGSAAGMDKDVAKRLFRDAGIPVVPFQTVRKFSYQENPARYHKAAAEAFGYPYFVKPANMGSSVGVHKVKTAEDASRAFSNAFAFDTKVLVERAIDARELECAVLGLLQPKASIVGEIVPHHEFYTYEAKYLDDDGAALLIPAHPLTQEQQQQIQKYSVLAFEALECRGLARVDFFLDRKTGDIYLNEVNTMPGFTPISMYPKLWEATGIPYSQLIDKLISFAMESSRERRALATDFTPAVSLQ